MKTCSYCGTKYPDDTTVCPLDQTPLDGTSSEIDTFTDEPAPSTSKKISDGEGLGHILLAILLVGYGAYGVCVNDLYIPGRHSRGVHLHGTSALLMFMAMICAALSIASVAFDHFDDRDKERYYHIFARVCQFAGWTFFGLSIVWGLFNGASR